MNEEIQVRPATVAEAEKLLAIYKPYVVSEDRTFSDVSFEYELPSVEKFAERIASISKRFPYLVCQRGEEILGYVYAHPFIERAAYQWGTEVTIYLAPAGKGWGLGKVLYTALEQILALQHVVHAYACVTKSNLHSVGMHESQGYKMIGDFENTGFKHGHWLDMVWMGKTIAPLPENPQFVIPWQQVPKLQVQAVLTEAKAKVESLLKQ